VLLAAYPQRHDLERMLFYCPMRRRLADYAGEVGMVQVAFQLLSSAVAEGWLVGLVDAVLADRPNNPEVRAWVSAHGWASGAAEPAPPADQQLLDTAFFDLTGLKRVIQAAKVSSPSRLLAFGVDYSEPVFIKKLCSWLPYCIGEVELKEWLNLRPELASVDIRIKHITRYLADLEWVNVLCPVLADGVATEVVSAFWDGVRAHCGEPDRWFVVIFAGRLSDGYPPGITPLPPPLFDRVDLTFWAQEVVSRRGWPAPLAEAWSGLLAEAAADGASLDVRLLYEKMDDSIRHARQDPAGFRRTLEMRREQADREQAERMDRADPSPR
jgi:hypothetical protein